jgi:hypothetical protein
MKQSVSENELFLTFMLSCVYNLNFIGHMPACRRTGNAMNNRFPV